MTYNIQDGGNGRIDDIVKIFKLHAPDFISVNEASDFDKNDARLLKELSKKVGLRHYYLALSAQSRSHVVVLSRYPFKTIQELRPLKNAGVVVTIATDLGDISVAAVHLASIPEDVRLNELNIAISQQAKCDLRIVIGDLNSLSERDDYGSRQKAEVEKPRYDVVNKLEQSGYFDAAVECGKQKEYTVPITQDNNVIYRNLRLDYIFVSEYLKRRLSNYMVINNELTEKASDHFPVIVEFNSNR